MRSTLALPPSDTTKYVRVLIDGDTAGYLNTSSYDIICRTPDEFQAAMGIEGATEEPHTSDGRWVVRLRGEVALRALHVHLSLRVAEAG